MELMQVVRLRRPEHHPVAAVLIAWLMVLVVLTCCCSAEKSCAVFERGGIGSVRELARLAPDTVLKVQRRTIDTAVESGVAGG